MEKARRLAYIVIVRNDTKQVSCSDKKMEDLGHRSNQGLLKDRSRYAQEIIKDFSRTAQGLLKDCTRTAQGVFKECSTLLEEKKGLSNYS